MSKPLSEQYLEKITSLAPYKIATEWDFDGNETKFIPCIKDSHARNYAELFAIEREIELWRGMDDENPYARDNSDALIQTLNEKFEEFTKED